MSESAETEKRPLVDDSKGIGSNSQSVCELMRWFEFLLIVLRWFAVGSHRAARRFGFVRVGVCFRHRWAGWPEFLPVCRTTDTVWMNVRRVADLLGGMGLQHRWQARPLPWPRSGRRQAPAALAVYLLAPRYILSGMVWQSQLGPPNGHRLADPFGKLAF